MKQILKFVFFISLVAALFHISCQKELSCENCAADGTNKLPIAIAGSDQTIMLPIDSVTIDGSASSDPDGSISSYLWTKISGPASFTINNASAATTVVKNLAVGLYQFELKVTDNGGLSAKDTVQVISEAATDTACGGSIRPQVNARLIPIGTLSQARTYITVASAGNKILFAGGYLSSRVDIYDIAANTWSTAELCVERYLIAAVAAGNKIFFGGGEWHDGTLPVDSVDIYDVSTNTWKVTHLSTAGHSIAAATVGNKVFFAGGDGGFTGTDREKRVDIYNLTTNTWSTASLSEVKARGHSAITVNNKIYFAGGSIWNRSSNKIDIYDNATNSWSTSLLHEDKNDFATIAVDNKIYWAGGNRNTSTSVNNSCLVEIKDVSSGTSSIQYLSSPGVWVIDIGQNAVVKDGKIVFFGYSQQQTAINKFDIYDMATNSWSIGILPQSISGASIISVNNIIYLAGGTVNGVILSNKVWKLEF